MCLSELPLIVLCGGLGTRLKSVLPDRPKVLAPVGDTCFIDYLLAYLKKQGIRHVILALGYQAEQVKTYLQGMAIEGINVSTIEEPKPLGTLGAVRYVLENCDQPYTEVMVMNGDTFIDLDLGAFYTDSMQKGESISMVATLVNDVSRYGSIALNDLSILTSFNEKQVSKEKKGRVNGGVYFIRDKAITDLKASQGMSLERDFLSNYVNEFPIFGFQHEGVFLDIGTPESLEEAKDNYKKLKGLMC